MFKRPRVGLLLLVYLALSAVTPLWGQTGLASITGTVSDPTGAVIADAPIVVRNLGNGQVSTAATTATGNYTISQLPVGDYELSVTVAGFKRYLHENFRLAASQTAREDVKLEVGAAAEVLTVTAETSLLRTESSELVQNVTLAQLKSLPVLPLGSTGAGFRDPFALMRMIPGATYTAGSVMVINGNPDDTVQVRLDGLTSNNTGFLRGTTQQTQPSVDAIEEVAVLTSNYAAEYGTAGGGIVNVVMKSGTNQYHGSVYDYMVNEALNSRQPYTGLRNRIRRSDYGGTFGGPVWIPKLYDGKNKTFFFWSWEQYRERTIANSAVATVPIPEYRAGNFAPLIAADNTRAVRVGTANYVDPLGRAVLSGMIFDPLSTRAVTGGTGTVRDQFVGNVIPASRFDPISVKVLALVPQPQGLNWSRGQYGNNYQNPFASNRTSEIPSLKVDQNIGSNGRFSGYWSDTVTAVQYAAGPGAAEGFPTPITASRGTFITGTTIRANYDHTISPTLLVHLGAGWSTLDFNDAAPVLDYNPEQALGLKGATLNRNFPVLTIGSSGTALGGLSSMGPNPQGRQFERRPAANVTVTWTKSNHTFKAGSEYRLEKFPDYNLSNTAGNYTFGTNSTIQTSLQGLNTTQGFTGMAFASFLLGDLTGVTLAQPLAAAVSKSQWALYVQDNWKATRKLTIDYGLRWDYGTYAREHYGRYGNFSPNVANASAGNHAGGRIYEATCKCNFADNYPYAVGPRVGFAYQLSTKTVLRGGFGVVYNATSGTSTNSGQSVNSANAGTPGFGQTVGSFKDGVPSIVKPIWPNFEPNAGQPVGQVVTAPTFLDPNAGRPARQYQWSIGLQREITRNLVVEATYVANRGVWWVAALDSLNVLRQSDLTRFGFNDFTSASESALLTTNMSALNATQRSTLAARGILLPYSNFPTNQTVRQSILPFPQYSGGISPGQAPMGKTWYDGLQLNVTQRYSRGLTFNMNYTYSKNLDLMGSPDIFNRSMGKDLSANDIPQRFRLTVDYQVPSMRNAGLGILSNPIVSAVFADWGIGAYMQYQSGAVLGRPSNQGTIPISNFLGRGPGSAQLKVVDGEYMNPWSVNWVDYDGKQRTDPIDINCHCFDPTKNQVLNPAAWENIPNGQWGAQQTTLRGFRGFRYPAENLNISRNFRVKERVTFHVRAEFTNVMNRTQLGQPSSGGANYTAQPTTFATGTNAGLYSGGFGTIVPVNGTGGARAGTLIGRITF